MPISPLCDKHTVKRAESQLGFLKFIIQPTYTLLGNVLPQVKEEVMPVIDANISYWAREKSRMSIALKSKMCVDIRKSLQCEKRGFDIKEEEEGKEEEEEEEEEETTAKDGGTEMSGDD